MCCRICSGAEKIPQHHTRQINRGKTKQGFTSFTDVKPDRVCLSGLPSRGSRCLCRHIKNCSPPTPSSHHLAKKKHKRQRRTCKDNTRKGQIVVQQKGAWAGCHLLFQDFGCATPKHQFYEEGKNKKWKNKPGHSDGVLLDHKRIKRSLSI